MTDFRSRFRDADRIPAPDLWQDIVTREPLGPVRPSLWPRVAVAAAALAIATLGLVLLVRAFLPRTTPTDQPSPTPTGAFRPEPKSNGRIALIRTDPESMIQEGGFPLSDLYIVDPDGSDARRLIGQQGFLFRADTSWAPDGTLVDFRIAYPWKDGIRVTRRIEEGFDILTATQPRFTGCMGPECEGESDPSWAPDGSRLAFSRTSDRSSLWTVNEDGSNVKLLNEEFVTIDAVAWSPLGDEIAVLGYVGQGPEVGPSRIYFVNPESGRITRTVDAPPGLEFAGTVSWSPDGAFLAFDAFGEGGTFQGAGVYVMRADGTGVRLLTACPTDHPGECTDMHPAWSPSGTFVAFTRALPEPGSDGFMGDIFYIDVDGGELRRVTGGPGLDCCPAWQPVPTG